MNFVAIDFETACQFPSSACSLGLTVVENGKVTEQKQWLIRPQEMQFSKYNIATHHITPDMVKTAPTFADLWPELRDYVENATLAAHNASFDMNFLHHTAEAYGIKIPNFRSVCSVTLARAAWPSLANHQLSTVACALHIDLLHHQAKSDAAACAQIVMNACQALRIATMRDCFDQYPASIAYSNPDRDFWDDRGYEIHFSEDQIKRQASAKKVVVQSINIETSTGTINDYEVTLSSCKCRDFHVRQRPCKHMYRLAMELKLFDPRRCYWS